jgi:hypothetical protein
VSRSIVEDYIEAQDLDELYELAAGNLWAWVCCPCPGHMFMLGVAAGTVIGYGPSMVLDAATQIVRECIASGELDLSDGVDVLVLNDLARRLIPE